MCRPAGAFLSLLSISEELLRVATALMMDKDQILVNPHTEELNPHAYPFLQKARDYNIRKELGIPTNSLGNTAKEEKAEFLRRSLEDLLGETVHLRCLSVGERKPNPKGFVDLARSMKLNEEDVVMVIDDQFSGILGANRFTEETGIVTIPCLVKPISWPELRSMPKVPLNRYLFKKLGLQYR